MLNRTFFSLALLFCLAAPSLAAEPDRIDYNRDIRPILSANCFACHGFDEHSRQADLRLDVEESAHADRDGVPAIVPGDVEASELWRRIISEDESEQMPPPDSNKTLTAEDKAKIRQWIEEGAKYAKHWSFIPPAKAELPEVSDPSWPRNEIDRFVLAKLDAHRPPLKPSPEADRYTLIRRLSLDLTGLPPTAEEVDAFVSDTSEDAYERLVDRLLASPHFGERMALDWLDAARYADTNGFSIDGGRHIWLWRDWVIGAFNENKPYDEFLLEQIAGDLLPEPTKAQLVATGFQRNNMVTHEGGTIPEENLVNYNADRVKTLGEAVLGLTFGCAQCHDHKYDPITQRDYYSLFAYFNTLSDIGLDGNGGKNPKPEILAKTVLSTGEAPQLERDIAALREKLANPDPAQLEAWEAAQREALKTRGADFELHPVELIKVSTPNAGAGFGIEDERFVQVSAGMGLLAYDVSMKLPTVDKPITGFRIVFHPHAKARNGGWGFGAQKDLPRTDRDPEPESDKGTFVLSTLSASASVTPADQVDLHGLIDARQVTASSWLTKFPPEDVLDTRYHNGWSPVISDEQPIHITFTFAEPMNAADAPYLTTQLFFGYEKWMVATRFEIFAMTGEDTDSTLPADVIEIVETASTDRTDEQQQRLREYFAHHAAETRPLRVDLANLEERLAVITQEFPTMVMDVSEKPRETFILNRGDYTQPTEKVTAATPESLPPLPEGAPDNRLGLARWVIMDDHPLTSRVAVNRFWQLFFGEGIVRTPADFGAQGEWPTHPELLDWLAVDFVENGWDVKALVRKIVTSATYRQSSATSAQLVERDPGNRLLARGPRFRLPAEFIRDAALKTSGLLVSRLGGPSVNPYTPGDLWREVSHFGSSPATAQAFIQDHGEKLYRRSLYTYWKRTAPPPNMLAFDAPNRETCVVDRPATITPLQSLVLLNDVQFVEASRAFAERIIHRGSVDDERLRWAFKECISRPPTDQEMAVLVAALERERARYANDEDAAREYLSNGESARDESIPVAEHAAWAQVAALLLNLNEFITRN